MEFSDELITRYAQEAEAMLAADTKCIQTRISIALTKGESTYALPPDITAITRVTYLGFSLLPYSGYEKRQSGTLPGSSSQSKPTHYIHNELGYKEIQLYPSPMLDLPAGTGDLWSSDSISTCFIIQIAAPPDFTGQTQRVPMVIRRQYIKDYVLARCFRREGKAMDIKSSTYFDGKFNVSKRQMQDITALLHACVEKVIEDNINRRSRPGRPVLPPQFGEIVE